MKENLCRVKTTLSEEGGGAGDSTGVGQVGSRADAGGEHCNNRSIKGSGGFSISWHLQGRMLFRKAVKCKSK